MQIKVNISVRGTVTRIIEFHSGEKEITSFQNMIIDGGKRAIATYLSGVDSPKISHMVFGNGGSSQGQLRMVKPEQNELFGITHIKKKVIGQMEDNHIVFATTIEAYEINDTINEMALQLDNSEIFSIVTMPDFVAPPQLKRITWKWYLAVI